MLVRLAREGGRVTHSGGGVGRGEATRMIKGCMDERRAEEGKGERGEATRMIKGCVDERCAEEGKRERGAR